MVKYRNSITVLILLLSIHANCHSEDDQNSAITPYTFHKMQVDHALSSGYSGLNHLEIYNNKGLEVLLTCLDEKIDSAVVVSYKFLTIQGKSIGELHQNDKKQILQFLNKAKEYRNKNPSRAQKSVSYEKSELIIKNFPQNYIDFQTSGKMPDEYKDNTDFLIALQKKRVSKSYCNND